MHDLFVDRLGNVTIGNGVARLDFLRLESIDNDKQQVTMNPSTRLVIPLDGLMQAIQMLEKARDQIVKQGQVSSTDKQEP